MWTTFRPRCPGALLAVALLSACGDKPEPGDVDLEIVADAVRASVIQAVRVTVTSGDGTAFAPISVVANRLENRWLVSLSSVPSGPGRLFSVEARDASGQVAFAGASLTDVPAGKSLRVAVLLQESGAPALAAGSAPVVTSVVAASGVVAPGGEARLEAHAVGAGPSVDYQWTVDYGCGEFSSPDQPITIWYAVGVVPYTTCPISLSVSDGAGSSVSVMVPIDVGSP
jgi:hypothetical protein